MNTMPTAPNDLLTPAQVAGLLSVDPKTVSRWASTGKIQSIRTPGGHRRFLRSEILAMTATVSDVEPPADWQPVIVQTSASPLADPGRDASGRCDRLAEGLAAKAVILAVQAQAAHSSADLVAASDAVLAAARRTAAAEAVAGHAFRTASDLKLRADASARQLTQAALEVAALVMAASHSDRDPEDSTARLELANHVKAAAVTFTVSVTDILDEREAATSLSTSTLPALQVGGQDSQSTRTNQQGSVSAGR